VTNRDTVEVELSARDRRLILEYGYPFDRIKAAIEECGASQHDELLDLDRFELERLIGDLSYSINKRTRGHLQMELYDLCERLESTVQGHSW
jgi:hypothetical protein